METKSIKEEDIKQLIRDVEMLKEVLFCNKNLRDPEGELTDWARNELEKARGRDVKISHEEVKRKILSKK